MLYLFLFVGLVINTALSFLVAHGLIPSLVRNDLATTATLPLRPILYVVFAISGLLAAFTFSQAIRLIVEVLTYFYPRFAI
jgi:hypothetical protein